jgi:GAF domain-containing protein
MDGLLQTVADLAKSVLPGGLEVSVTLVAGDRPTTIVSTGQVAIHLDETQYEDGRGPCLHAATTGQLTEVADTRADHRWPDFTARAVERGTLSSLSVPLAIDEEPKVSGALNFYAREPNAFDGPSRTAAVAFGRHAAVASRTAYAYQIARDTAYNLHTALESRAVIDQAKGVLVERHKLTPDQAFDLLVRVSMHSNRKVRDVADHLVHTGDLPDVGRRGTGRRAEGEPGPGSPRT